MDKEEKDDRDPEKSKYIEKSNIKKDLPSGKQYQEDIGEHSEQEKVQGDGDVLSHSNPVRKVRDEGSGGQDTSPVNYTRSPSTDCNTGVRSRRILGWNKQSSHLDGNSESSQQPAEESTNSADIIRQIEVTRLVSCVLGAVLSRWLLPTLLGYLVLKVKTISHICISVGTVFLALEMVRELAVHRLCVLMLTRGPMINHK